MGWLAVGRPHGPACCCRAAGDGGRLPPSHRHPSVKGMADRSGRPQPTAARQRRKVVGRRCSHIAMTSPARTKEACVLGRRKATSSADSAASSLDPLLRERRHVGEEPEVGATRYGRAGGGGGGSLGMAGGGGGGGSGSLTTCRCCRQVRCDRRSRDEEKERGAALGEGVTGEVEEEAIGRGEENVSDVCDEGQDHGGDLEHRGAVLANDAFVDVLAGGRGHVGGWREAAEEESERRG